MKVIDLFSGIGGFSIGLERAGMETVAFCEIENFPKKVLNERWPHVPTFPGIYALNSLLRRVRKRSSQPDFLAKTYHSRERVPAYPASVRDSSGLSYEPFAWFDHDTRCWRTWQSCLVEGWQPYSGAWPRSGMTRNGIAFQRQPLVLLTSGIASGSLLPTPEASNTKAIALRSAGRSPRNFLAPLPTPTARSYGSNQSASSGAAVRPSLAQMARNGMWPTPDASPHKYRLQGDSQQSKSLNGLAGGQLNPTWVEWLMGFPLGWTALKLSETPSSRKSRKSLGAQS